MLKRLIFVTGRPGVGKTTIVVNAVNELKSKGHKVGGMVSREVREEGTRIGFEIIDITTGQKGWLAHVNQPAGPQVSRYRVNIKDLDQIGVSAIQNALKDAQIIIVDEIGPMELFSSAFREVLNDVLDSSKPALGVIHQGAHDPIVGSIKDRPDSEILTVTLTNRGDLHKVLIQRANEFLRMEKSQIKQSS